MIEAPRSLPLYTHRCVGWNKNAKYHKKCNKKREFICKLLEKSIYNMHIQIDVTDYVYWYAFVSSNGLSQLFINMLIKFYYKHIYIYILHEC